MPQCRRVLACPKLWMTSLFGKKGEKSRIRVIWHLGVWESWVTTNMTAMTVPKRIVTQFSSFERKIFFSIGLVIRDSWEQQWQPYLCHPDFPEQGGINFIICRSRLNPPSLPPDLLFLTGLASSVFVVSELTKFCEQWCCRKKTVKVLEEEI